MMEAALRGKKERFDSILRELESSISAIEQLKTLGDMNYDFELGSTLYAKAMIPEEKRKVGLWLGAGVMLEHELDGALDFLKRKRDDRMEEIKKVEHDLLFIRKQVTAMEVNVARVYNFIIRQSKSQ